MIWLKPTSVNKAQADQHSDEEEEFFARQVTEKLKPTPKMDCREIRSALQDFNKKARDEQKRLQAGRDPVESAKEILKVEEAVMAASELAEKIMQIE